jgi:phospholipase C
MKKISLIASIFLLASFAAHAAVTISSKVDAVSDHKWIKPWMLITNSTTTPFDLKGNSINYYFYESSLDITTLSYSIWNPSTGSSDITIKFFKLSPTSSVVNGKKANYECRVQFTQSRIIAAGKTFEVSFGFHKPDWSLFTEGDDWSYVTNTSYALNPKTTLDNMGNIIYGTPPTLSGTQYPIINSVTVVPSSSPSSSQSSPQYALQTALATVTPDAITKDATITVTAKGQNLTYNWTVTLGPSQAAKSAVVFSSNNSTSNTTTATFFRAGGYDISYSAKSKNVTAIESFVGVTVIQVPTSIVVSPPGPIVYFVSKTYFKATEYDQFGFEMNTQPTFFWTINTETQAFIHQDGMVQASMTPGTFEVTAQDEPQRALSGIANFTIADKMDILRSAKEKIKHVIIIMQENRSFDNYFGKFKPENDQKIDTLPFAGNLLCRYEKANTPSTGAPTGTYEPAYSSNTTELDYRHEYEQAISEMGDPTSRYLQPWDFISTNDIQNNHPDQNVDPKEIVGYHIGSNPATQNDIPNYYTLAKNFVLQDHMFEPVKAWSKVSHLYMVSGWSANSARETSIEGLNPPESEFSWNNIAQLLSGSQWGYYQGVGWTKNYCDKRDFQASQASIPPIWNPLASFPNKNTNSDPQNPNITHVRAFFDQIASNKLPQVCWICPDVNVSEHAQPSRELDLKTGHAYVTSIINGIMSNQALWESSVIFLSWDDWGGFYDHVRPPITKDGFGYGIRVPGLMISPYAKKNFVDQQILSHDAYLKFIEDLFLNGDRIPNDDGRPSQRETEQDLGDLLYEFDFSQTLTYPPAGYPMPCVP